MALSTTLLPSGSVQLFYNTSAPTGWVKSTDYHNYALRVVSGTAGVGRGYPMVTENVTRRTAQDEITGVFSDVTSTFTTSVTEDTYSVPVSLTGGSATIETQGAIGTASPSVGFNANDAVVFTVNRDPSLIGSTLPVGLTSGTTYYIKQILSNSTFTVSATAGGAAITITSAGSGLLHQYFTAFRMRFDDTSLTTSQIPAHYHAAYKDNGSNSNDSHQWTSSGKRGTAVPTTSAGSGTAHSHTYTIPMTVYYANVIACTRS